MATTTTIIREGGATVAPGFTVTLSDDGTEMTVEQEGITATRAFDPGVLANLAILAPPLHAAGINLAETVALLVGIQFEHLAAVTTARPA